MNAASQTLIRRTALGACLRTVCRTTAAALVLYGAGSTRPLEASPHWEAITLADQGTFYIDPASIVREGSIRKFASALDHKSVQTTSDGKPYWSNETQIQIDCQARLARVVHLTLYSGKMLSGQPVLREGILREWQPITATSAIEKLARRVC